jgi:hypothetical protein
VFALLAAIPANRLAAAALASFSAGDDRASVRRLLCGSHGRRRTGFMPFGRPGRVSSILLYTTTFLAVVLLTSCGGDRDDKPESPIAPEKLAAMVPEAREFPPEVLDLAPLSLQRGYVSNAKASAQTRDPSDSAADLARLGRTGGYRNDLSTYSYVMSLAWANASVDAFRSDEEAQNFLNGRLSALRSSKDSKDPETGGNLSAVGNFVPVAMSSAIGVRYTVVLRHDRLHLAVVGFQVGRVDGWSEVARIDDRDPAVLAVALARTLRTRMERALASDPSTR